MESAVVATPRRHRMPEVVKSAVRALEILEFFDRWQGPVSVGTIAADLGYPQSSTSALMRSLVKVGYLTYDAHERTFLPTRRVPLLGSWLGNPFYRDGPVLEVARILAERTGLAVGIARRNNITTQWLHALPSPEVSAADVFSDRAPLTHSAAGLNLLSMLDDRQAQGLVHRINAEMEELDDVIPWTEMKVRITETRRDGHAFADDGNLCTLSMLAPISVTSEGVALALVDSHATLREELPTMIAIMRETMATMRSETAPDAIMLRSVERSTEHNWRPSAAHA